MSDRPTPETDAMICDGDDYEVVPSDFARLLERQRDAAVEALRDVREDV